MAHSNYMGLGQRTVHNGPSQGQGPGPLLPPATKLGQGNVFSSVCQEFCPQLVAAAETRIVGKRAVRYLLECFLVSYCASPVPCEHFCIIY